MSKEAVPTDTKAVKIVCDYIARTERRPVIEQNVFIVWKCKTLQNWKYILSTSIVNGLLFELTYNGNRDEWYLDVYRKQENCVISG